MPFDESRPAKFIPGHTGLRQLSAALRAEMPLNFEWDFSVEEEKHSCGTAGCAMGLMRYIWPESIGEDFWIERISEALDMPEDNILNIFYSPSEYKKNWHEISPTDVADAIDNWLEANSK